MGDRKYLRRASTAVPESRRSDSAAAGWRNEDNLGRVFNRFFAVRKDIL